MRGGGTLGVVVQGQHSKEAFCMEHRGNITSLKFSPDHSRLAVQRTSNSLVSVCINVICRNFWGSNVLNLNLALSLFIFLVNYI